MPKRHLEKIKKIFSHPTPANLNVKKVISALEHCGVEVSYTKKHTAKLFFGEKEAILQLPHSDNFTKDEVIKLRHILEDFGLTPEKLEG